MPAVIRVSVLVLTAVLAPQSISSPPAPAEIRSSAVLPAAAIATPQSLGSQAISVPPRVQADSSPSAWFTALIIVLLIGHQLRRKHRLLRPQRFDERFTI